MVGAVDAHGVTVVAVVTATAVATALGGVRWLRVAQREHYAVDATSRFALRWWSGTPLNLGVLVVGLAGLALAGSWPAFAFATAAVVAVGPFGLTLRGRTSALTWTRRLRTLAAVWVTIEAAGVVVGVLAGYGAVAGAAAALAVPALVDLAALVTAPFENRLARAHVKKAAARLGRVAPTVVAITGSFGKTSTKSYVTHLLSGSRSVVASPASFNNRAGLARSVNEHLAEGTDVFVAEMGTYGPGEIAELCSWIKPDVAVITAVGPVHLERFGSVDRVVEAKAEILDRARCGVIVEDDVRLAALADARAAKGMRIVRVSTRRHDAEVCVVEDATGLTVNVGGQEIARSVRIDARPGNVAAAVAVAIELGMTASDVVLRLPTLPAVPHRLAPTVEGRGVVILDDTYNSNPAGAAVALEVLSGAAAGAKRRAVVTPGMVELGSMQKAENERFARHAAKVATDVVVVGRTNRRALLRGARSTATANGDVATPGAGAPPDVGATSGAATPGDGARPGGPLVITVRDRAEATRWVRENLVDGDVVLYENDLPDHYP